MEVTVVTRKWDPSGGGCEAYLSDLVHHLRLAGHGVRISAGEKPPPAAGNPVLASYPFPGATHYQLHSGILAEGFAAERESFDSGARRLLYWPALRLNRRRRALLADEEKIFSGRARPRLMVWSESLRSQLLLRYGISPEEISISVPGVDLRRFHPGEDREGLRARFVGEQSEELLILFVGHDFARKGLRWVIEALHAAKKTGLRCKLLVAGAGRASPFRRRAARLGIAQDVEFLGGLDRDDLPGLYTACDVLVLPTFYDPFSLVALEAMACGCPVITTRANGASQLIEPGRQGFLLENPRDTKSIVRALAVLQETQPNEGMRLEAIRVARRHPFDAHANEVLAWLET